MRVCVQGLWHLGSVTAACLASVGHDVVGLDFVAETIEGLNRSEPPVLEPGLPELIEAGLSKGTLTFVADPVQATKSIDVLWVAYDTPVDDDDNADIDFVVSNVERLLPLLPMGVVVLISSQLPIGTTRRLERLALNSFPEKQIEFAYSPENLRLGKALDVFLNPDRIVVGVRSLLAKQRLEMLLNPVTNRVEWMSVESAEMTKHAINAFLATSVTFANEIAALCELTGADAKQVERGLKTEQRIGPKAYLSPGAAFAGGTLARDIAFLNQVGDSKQLKTPLLASVRPSNNEHKNWTRRKLLQEFPNLASTTIAVWGLTYKVGTDTLRRSLAVELCDWLIAQGAKVRIHDPVVKDLPAHWSEFISRHTDPIEALRSADALVVAAEWPLYKQIPADQILKTAPAIVVLDANRFISSVAGVNGLRYLAVGTPGNVE